MCDDIHEGLIHDPTVSRRTFGLISMAAAGGIATGANAAADVVEKDVEVKTPDGVADAALYYPAGKGKWPAVLIWCDFLSLRPVFREMGRRLAGAGYVVLVPNFYYRSKKAPVFEGAFNFASAADRAKITPMRALLTNAAVDKDAAAYVDFLDAQPQTDKKKGVGVQGYCMGGPLTFRTAVVRANRVRGAASFHGGGLVTKDPESPHLHVGKTKAGYLVAVAKNDDDKQPEAKGELKAALDAAKLKSTVEVYAADHGWCVKGSPVYNEAEAERAWAELLKLYKANL